MNTRFQDEHKMMLKLVPEHVLDECRRLLSRIQPVEDTSPIIVGVTSAISGEGKTTIALGLALVVASDIDEPVCLIELDFDHSSLTQRLEAAGQTTGNEWMLMSNLTIRTAEQIQAESTVGNPSRLIKHWIDDRKMEQLKTKARLIVLDLPALNTTSYGIASTILADRVLLVIRANVTPEVEIKKAVAGLEPERVAGVVLNGTTTDIPRWLRQFF